MNYDFLEGRKFCVVFVKVLDAATERVQLRCLRGRANVEPGKVSIAAGSGNVFTIPQTAMATIRPNDGTELLKDAEYFCLVKVNDNIDLGGGEDGDIVLS